MPEQIYSPELQMWQKGSSEHKPESVLDKAGSAGLEDLAVFTFGTAADANTYTDICAIRNAVAMLSDWADPVSTVARTPEPTLLPGGLHRA